MPRITLKPNSAEYITPEDENAPYTAACDMPGCKVPGDNKAPKNRGLDDFHHFCEEHIREYNKAWNFFEGMSDHEVQDQVKKDRYGDRPTWKHGASGGDPEDILRDKAKHFRDKDTHRANKNSDGTKRKRHIDATTPEGEAMAIMGLEPPVTLDDIKKRYKELAKKHHPDLNRGCDESEERLKRINMAYTILKVAYEAFDKLPDKHR
jgi:hypothetical protein